LPSILRRSARTNGTERLERFPQEQHLATRVRALHFDQEICDWVATALREIHGDETKAHEQEVARLLYGEHANRRFGDAQRLLLPLLDTYRTLIGAPSAEIRAAFDLWQAVA
jgi:hypothetical protein